MLFQITKNDFYLYGKRPHKIIDPYGFVFVKETKGQHWTPVTELNSVHFVSA